MKLKAFIVITNILIYSSLFLVLFQTIHAQQKEVVKPVILIPSTIKVSPQELDQYKKDVLLGLREVQSFYWQKLNGKTFQFASEIKVLNPPPLENFSKAVNASSAFEQLGGRKILPPEPGTIFVVWTVGANVPISNGWTEHLVIEGGYAVLSYENLLDLKSNSPPEKRDESLGVLAHELGHALGLVFDGWAKGHPCSEVSSWECLDTVPKGPLPSEEEYTYSVMGIGYSAVGFRNSIFNNSTYNPEVKKLFNSPFINPQKETAPQVVLPKLPENQAQIGQISPNPISGGGVLEITGFGFGFEKGYLSFYNPYYSNLILEDFIILEWSDELIRVGIGSVTASRSVSSKWRVKILDQQKKVKGISEDYLTLNYQQPPPIDVTFNFKLTCGLQRRSLGGVEVNLVEALNPKNALASTISDEYGLGEITYTSGDRGPNETFLAIPKYLEEVTRAQPDSIRISLPDYPATYLVSSGEFHYPNCPTTGAQIGEPNPPRPNITPLPSISTEASLEQIQISNYPDFRASNSPVDQGSSTVVLTDPNQNQQVSWNPSTSNPNEPVYVREVYDDGTVTDYQADLDGGQATQVGNVVIEAKELKKIARIVIADEEVFSIETNVNKIEDGFSLSLGDSSDNPQTFNVSVLIEYSNGSRDYLGYEFNYNPPQTCPNWQLLRHECVSCGMARIVEEDSCNLGTTEIKKDENGDEVYVQDEGCTGSEWCASDDTQEPTDSCPNFQPLRNECIKCGYARVVEEDQCNPGTTQIRKNENGDEVEVRDTGCDGSDWCQTEEPAPDETCDQPYTQCGGTAGLEEYAEDVTVEVISCTLSDGSVEYRKTVLDDNPGGCP